MRIRPLEKNQASFSARLLFSAVKRQVGKVLTPLKVQAHRPGIMWGFAVAGMAAGIFQGRGQNRQAAGDDTDCANRRLSLLN